MGHKIDLDGLLKFKAEEKILYASSSKENKKLYITLNGNYEVFVNKELVLETMHSNFAIEKYNTI